ncbi:hypothetical protein DSO57_1038581 [Entomophthora muscae]|uniref:Uncharacterized protein n=1 Tax=Entomophthora muscae TaxID=34485 RepID=A0ACC2TX74_9FUNG|nr:hypothetical protein DSO57_1038581 [Entomophthora muscae]
MQKLVDLYPNRQIYALELPCIIVGTFLKSHHGQRSLAPLMSSSLNQRRRGVPSSPIPMALSSVLGFPTTAAIHQQAHTQLIRFALTYPVAFCKSVSPTAIQFCPWHITLFLSSEIHF